MEDQNIIQIADVSSFRVGRLTLSDKSRVGPCILSPPSGLSIMFKGFRYNLISTAFDYFIAKHESGQTWINLTQSPILFTLPSGAEIGTTARFLRTGGVISISPNSNGSIWHSTSGLFRPTGQTIKLASSGAMAGLISNGENGWYPIIEKGIIL